MGSIFRRGRKLYLKTKHVNGTWKQIPTHFEDNAAGRAAAAKMLRGLEGKVAAWRADFKTAPRGRFAKKFPTLAGKGVQSMHPRVVDVSFTVTQEVAAALRTLRDTGLFGNGVDCASVAEELLRKALLDSTVLPFWRKP